MELPPPDYLLLAGRLNQLSLLPFLAFLWTLQRIAPPRLARAWAVGYAVFIAAAIPAGWWCRSELGAALGNDVNPVFITDANGDGAVNAVDIQLVINAALGLA